MSNKGKDFTHSDLSHFTQARIKNKQVGPEELERIDAHLAAQTERNRIVAIDDDGNEIITEELLERAMRHHASLAGETDGVVLASLRSLMALTGEQRDQVLSSFDEGADLLIPFDPPKNGKAAKPKK